MTPPRFFSASRSSPAAPPTSLRFYRPLPGLCRVAGGFSRAGASSCSVSWCARCWCWNHLKFPIPRGRKASLRGWPGGLEKELMLGSERRFGADLDRIRHAVVRLEFRERRLQPVIDGAMLVRAVSHDEIGRASCSLPIWSERRFGGDLDRIRPAVVRLEFRERRLQPVIDGAMLVRAVGHDEDLGAALLENELCRPRARLLESRRVLGIEKLPELP